MSNRCPKCNKKISPFYLKQNCPECGTNLLYYNFDEQLEEDARNAQTEVERVNKLKETIKNSTVKTKWHIVRLVLFFLPLASMCLPMYYADHKSVSLISVIMAIVNHGFNLSFWSKDYVFGILAMAGIIVLSLAVIIGSLFSSTKRGYRRNIILSLLNVCVFGALSFLVCRFGGECDSGFLVTMFILITEFGFHYTTTTPKTKKKKYAYLACEIISIVLLAVCALYPCSDSEISAVESVGADIRAVSFNTAAPWGTFIDDTSSSDRVVRFSDTVKAVQPDLVGTQELNQYWVEKLETLLPEYECYSVIRGGDGNDYGSERNGVFWKKDRFTAVETNTFWLSNTPEVESRYTYTDENGEQQSAACNRICSYAVLKDNESGELVGFFNTHLDHVSTEAMRFGAELILKRIDEIKSKYGDIRIVLTGDFNQSFDGAGYKIIVQSLNDTTDPAKLQATYQEWGYCDTGSEPIDFIFTNGNAQQYEVLDDLSEGYVSDHYGIMADINF